MLFAVIALLPVCFGQIEFSVSLVYISFSSSGEYSFLREFPYLSD